MKTTRRSQRRAQQRLEEEARRNPVGRADAGESSAAPTEDQEQRDAESPQQPGNAPGPNDEKV